MPPRIAIAACGIDDVNKSYDVVLEAAKAFQDIVEAREKATGGDWNADKWANSINSEYKSKDGKNWDMKILDIRGWGHLTGKGHARGFSTEKATGIQRDNAKFITTAANIAGKWAEK